MPYTALASYLVLIVLAFGLRSFLQWRRTGSTGFKGVSGRFGSLEWVGGAMFVFSLVLAPVAVILGARGVVPSLPVLDQPTVRVAALFLYGIGLAATLAAQLAMGDEWRIGVDAEERTTLVTSGPFAMVRNPIFSALLLAAAGLALMVPNPVAFAALAAMLLAVEIQVRHVEEPYLLEAQGEEYAAYASRVGRFVPGVGLLASTNPQPR